MNQDWQRRTKALLFRRRYSAMQSGLLEQHVEIRWNSANPMVSDIEIMKSISKSILRSILNMIKHDSCSKILGFTVLRPYNYGRSSWNGQWWRVLSYVHSSNFDRHRKRRETKTGDLTKLSWLQSDQIVSFRPNVQGLGVGAGVARWCRFHVCPNFFHRWGGVPWLVSQ